MIATIALVLGGFFLVVRRSYRNAARSGPYRPEGKLRWDGESAPE